MLHKVEDSQTPKREPMNIFTTGKTKTQMVDEVKVQEFVEEQGIQAPQVKACYMCKRHEGEESVRVVDGEDKVQLVPIELLRYEVEMGEGCTFTYLCVMNALFC